MKIKFLGTAAAEGIPALFCECETCVQARKNGGKDIRTRSQALINNNLLIDFNADTYMHTIMHQLDLSKINHCIITHAHSDHLYVDNVNMRLPALSQIKDRQWFNLYGSEIVVSKLNAEFAGDVPQKDNVADFHVVKPFESFQVLDYEITPFEASHDQLSGPLIYMITQGEKTMLYAHDTGCLFQSVLDYLKEKKVCFDFVSLDCTEGFREMNYDAHMNVERCVKAKQTLLAAGIAKEHTLFYLNHFSHNGLGVLYHDLKRGAQNYGFGVSYDGLEIEF